jgi:HAD superfamily hydrolase (TIGR01509 family)
VIFDLDGVLMNSEWLAFLVWRQWTEDHQGQLPDSAFLEMVGTSAEETAEYIMKSAGITFDMQESLDWTWKELIRRIKVHIEAMPGALDLIDFLSKRGYPMAVASNSLSSYIEAALTGLNLLQYFPIRVGIDQVKYGKPAPDVFLRAAEQLSAAPHQCLVFEDSRVGVQAATSAGMRVIAVPTDSDWADNFANAWKTFPSLVTVMNNLDTLLA